MLAASGVFCTLALAYSFQTFIPQKVWDFVFCGIAVERSSNSLESLTGAANLLVSAALAMLTALIHLEHTVAMTMF